MLPKNLKYGSKVESANCKSFRTNIQPQNGTGPYNLGDTITFNIPTRRNLVMVPSESYLKFSILVTNTSTNPNYYRWDSCGAHGLINQIRVSHGSNQLENINMYGQLAKLMFDLQVNTPSSSGKFNILAGTRGDSMVSSQTIAGDADDVNGIAITPAAATGAQLASVLNSILNMSVVATNSGDYLKGAGAQGAVANNATTDVQTYCLNLISMCGSLCQNQYLPLFAMDSAPLRLDITLVDSITKMLSCASGGGTITVSNVEYVANMIELSDEAMMTIVNSLQGEPLQFVVPSWSNYQSTFPSGQTQINVPIPAKYSSVKSLFSSFRDRYNTALYMPYSSVSAGLSSYQYRIGSNLAPLKAPSTSSEYFAEVLKAIGSMSDNYHSPAIDKFSYTLGASTAEVANTGNLSYPHSIQRGNTTSGSFCVGLDLESFSNADKSSIFSGYNTNTDDIFLTLNYGTATPDQLRIDSFALFDQVLVCANSTAFVRF